MAEEPQEGFLAGSSANDRLQSLTQDISPETAQHAKKLVMALKNASEEDYNALLELLSKSKESDVEEKPSVETEGKAPVAGGNLVDCDNSFVHSRHTPEVSDDDFNAEDHHENGAGNLNSDINGQEGSKKDQCSETGKLENQVRATNENYSDLLNRSVSDDYKLPGLSDEAENLADRLPTTGENLSGDVHGHVSSSEDEKLPELLSGKAEDICSEIEDGNDKERFVDLHTGIDTSGDSKLTDLDNKSYSVLSLETPSQGDSLTNLLPGSTETEKRYPKAVDYGSSSDDEQMAMSSSHSEVTSTESELSDVVAPSDSAHPEELLHNDIRNIEDKSSSSVTVAKDDGIAVIDDDALDVEATEEVVVKSVQALERMSSVLSTGTQTSSEPEEHLQQDPLAKDQVINTLGGLSNEGLDSILGIKDKESSKLPFYYQPQIVMHEEQPILVLQPVLSSSSSPSNNGDTPGMENGAVKATVPIILPLTSPDIDMATKDAILKQINGDSAVTSSSSGQSDSKSVMLPRYSNAVPSSLNAAHLTEHSNDRGARSAAQASPDIKSTHATDESSEGSKFGKNEGLPEWVPPSELDKALSAATEGIPASAAEHTPTTLTFPRVSLPSTNPFAKDLAAQEHGHSEVIGNDLSSLGLDKTLQQSLFGPPTSSSVSSGARPKQVKANQEPGLVGNATNPFAPDLTPKKRGKRQEQTVTEHSNEVVVTAEVHPSVSQSAEINRPPHRTHRRRISSESMVTLIETTYADTPASSAELTPAAIDEPHKIIPAQEDPKPQLGSKETQADRVKPKLKVAGKVPPFWTPDFACSNCTNCNSKFTMFLRKHHCRGCGKIFCNNCCSQLARFPYMDYKTGRVCTSCTEVIKEVTRIKRNEDLAKQRASQQSPNRNQGPTTAPGLLQKTSTPQTKKPPQGLVISNAQAQRNPAMAPYTQTQRTGNPVPAVVPVNQGPQRNLSNQPVQHQQLPSSSAKVQNAGTLVPAVVQPQGSQGVMMPAQPANQYMWVPAHTVQPNMPVVYVNPVAPSLQGAPVFVPAAPLIPQQAPVMLMTSQPTSASRPPQATTQVVSTMASGGWKGAAPVANRTSSGTVSTFTVLPQQVGQSAVQSAQSRDVGGVKQSTAAVNQTFNTTSNVSTSGAPLSSQSRAQAAAVPGQPPTQTMSLPPAAPLQQSSSPVTTVVLTQTPPKGLPSITSLPQSSPQSVTPVAPSQTHPMGLPSTSPIRQSPSPATSATSPTQRSAHAVVNSPQKSTETQGSQQPREADGSFLVSDETDPSLKDFKPPLRRAGRTITWRYRTQGKSKIQEQRKSLAKDLKDLPNGVTIQAAQDLLVHVKKMKLKEKHREVNVWCYQSEGLNKFDHLEVVVMLEVRKKEDIFPEEVLRVYRGILHLTSKLGNRFQHGNYLSSNDQFLDSSNDAGFVLVSSEVKPKPPGLKEMQAPFLYGILVKRPELSAAMFTPSRLLLRLGYDMKSFPFPLWNSRDRRPVNFGNEREDRFYHTVFAMNKYLKNSVPEAMVPGLYVVKEDKKVILQIPNSGQSAVVGLLDRLVKKENQTATVPLLSDIPPYVDNCKVVLCNERGGKYVQSFGNPESTSVIGLGFLMLHLGVDASSPLSFGGELLDDGVLVFFSKNHTQKLRQSLEEKTNCYFYLGDKFDISHFELRWMQDVNYHDLRKPAKNNQQPNQTVINPYPVATTAATTPAEESGADYHPGLATIDIRYSGYGSEVEILKKAFEDHTKILHILEGNIRQACTEPLMKHENKMKSGEHQELQLRVVLRPSYKKWSVGPSDLPTALIRSLQMALHTVKVPVMSEGELVMSFDVSVVKQ